MNSALWNQVIALILNVKAWFVSNYLPKWLRPRQVPAVSSAVERCVIVSGPGGLDQLKTIELKGRHTVGYNVPSFTGPFVAGSDEHDPSLVLIKVSHFSVNFADVCIRWGLYESALRYVGWPIVPGFDFSGEVVRAHESSGFQQGDQIFGFSLFGAYSSSLLVPARQIRKTPSCLSQVRASGVPAVAATALHAVALAGAWPCELKTKNKGALIHSAAGGVGSMLIQICRIRGYSPIVAVVGSSHKVEYCLALGADNVIDKSSSSGRDWRSRAKEIAPSGFSAVFDANGVETLAQSFELTSMCGRLVIYGFHSNIPKAKAYLDPFEWLRMIAKMAQVPKFDPMALVLESKSVAGFNLSFFSDEHELIAQYMDQLVSWIKSGSLTVPDVTVFSMDKIADAHTAIQSGQSKGKIVIQV